MIRQVFFFLNYLVSKTEPWDDDDDDDDDDDEISTSTFIPSFLPKNRTNQETFP